MEQLSKDQLDQLAENQLAEIEEKRENLEVRYIKLGAGGNVAEDCFKNNRLYIGYGTHLQKVREWCNQARDINKRDLAVYKIQNYWVQKEKKDTEDGN